MKEIQSKNFIKKMADLVVHPPVFEEDDDNNRRKKDKKKKKIYQLNMLVEDVSVDELMYP